MRLDENLFEDVQLDEADTLAKPFKKDIKNRYKAFDKKRDAVRKFNADRMQDIENKVPRELRGVAYDMLLKKEPKMSREVNPYGSENVETKEFPFYVTHYEETPYYHPEEGGYYIAGRYAVDSKGFDNKEDALQALQEYADELGMDKLSDTSYGIQSKYIGDSSYLVIETAKDYLSREKGDQQYESLTESDEEVSEVKEKEVFHNDNGEDYEIIERSKSGKNALLKKDNRWIVAWDCPESNEGSWGQGHYFFDEETARKVWEKKYLNESINRKFLKENSTEDYWDATEIDRKNFGALLRFNFGSDSRGNNYIVTNDGYEVTRFYADSDEEAQKIFNNKEYDESLEESLANDYPDVFDSFKEEVYLSVRPIFYKYYRNNPETSQDDLNIAFKDATRRILSESLTEDIDDVVIVDVPDVITDIKEDELTPNGPQVGEDVGIADLLLELINGENDTIRDYNTFRANLGSHPEFASVIDDIANEENNHVGMLQTLLKQISPNVETIKQGEAEAEKDLCDDDLQCCEVPDFEVDDSFDDGFGGIFA